MRPLTSLTEIALNLRDKLAQASVGVVSLTHIVRTMSNVKVLIFCRRCCHGTHAVLHAVSDIAREFRFLVAEGAFESKNGLYCISAYGVDRLLLIQET